jgi:hypothetical protein
MRFVAYIFTSAAALGLSAAAANAQADRDQILRDVATQLVGMYDEAKSCMTTPEFQAIGFGPDGPCNAIMAPSNSGQLSAFSDMLVSEGYPCHVNFLYRIMSDNFEGAGGNGTPPFGTINPEFAAKFEDCRQKLEG